MIARYSVSLYNYTSGNIASEGRGVFTPKLSDGVIADLKSQAKMGGMAGEVALAADAFLTGAERGELKFESPQQAEAFKKAVNEIGTEQAKIWKGDHADRSTIGNLWDRFVADEDGDGIKNAKDSKPLGRY